MSLWLTNLVLSFEAFVAALYVDKGLRHVEVFCRVCLFPRLEVKTLSLVCTFPIQEPLWQFFAWILVTLSPYCLLVTSLRKIRGFISWCKETELRFLLCGILVNYRVRIPNFIRSMQPLVSVSKKYEKPLDGFNLIFLHKEWISSWNRFYTSVLFTCLSLPHVWHVLFWTASLSGVHR